MTDAGHGQGRVVSPGEVARPTQGTSHIQAQAAGGPAAAQVAPPCFPPPQPRLTPGPAPCTAPSRPRPLWIWPHPIPPPYLRGPTHSWLRPLPIEAVGVQPVGRRGAALSLTPSLLSPFCAPDTTNCMEMMTGRLSKCGKNPPRSPGASACHSTAHPQPALANPPPRLSRLPCVR